MVFVYTGWLSIASVAEAASIENVIDTGTRLGNLTPAITWAIVALISMLGLIKIYYDKGRDEQQLKDIIKETTSAIVKNTETLERLNNNIDKCPQR
jgi:hypothetical protein